MTFWKGMIAGVPGNRGLRKAIESYEWQLDDPDFGDNDDREPDFDTLGTMFITFSNAGGRYQYPGITWGEYLEYEATRTRPIF